jgi:hypothetical protein
MCDDILLRFGLVTAEHLEAARALQSREGAPLTECLVRTGAIDEATLVEALARALFLPSVTAADLAAVGADVLQLLPADLAIEVRALPLAVEDDLMTVAFADATDERGVAEVAFFAGRAVARVIAPPSAIRAELERHFGIRVLSQARAVVYRAARVARR